MDNLTPEQRKKNMSHIRSKDTSIEVRLRKALWHEGIRYRKNYTDLPGKPDIAVTKYKIAVFCDSSFFHGRDFASKKSRGRIRNTGIKRYGGIWNGMTRLTDRLEQWGGRYYVFGILILISA